MTEERVVYLAFRNDNLQEDYVTLFACKTCRNKTYVVVNDGQDDYPILRCAACNAKIGRIGWTEGDKE